MNNQNWDAIIIGSGLGGLTAGTLLSQAGKKVLILEKHTVPGGFTHTFTRKGFEWDVGVHYVGQMDHSKSILKRVFDYITNRRLQWAQMGVVYDRVIIGKDTYNLVTGVDNQIQQLIEYFPDEEEAIRKYYRLIRKVSASGAWFFGEKTMPWILSQTAGFFLRRRFEKWSSRTTDEVIRSITQNEKLISVLSAQCGNYGLSPKRSSFGIHAAVVEHYLYGGNYPVGGARSIHENILQTFRENQGVLALKSEVVEILMEKGRVVGVQLKNGEKIFSNVVISNAGARNTFLKLLPKGPHVSNDIYSSLEKVQASTSHICLYVGLKKTDDELNLPKYNFWIYDQYQFDESLIQQTMDTDRLPMAYISFPSAKDPSHPGKATIQIIAPCPYDYVKQWEEKPWMKRGQDYLELKKRLSDKLLKKLFEVLPQVKDQVEYAELSTPLSTQHFMSYGQGEIYGLEHTPDRFRLRWLRPKTKIKGLYLTGQDIVSVGVGGALYSGVLASSVVLNKSVILRVLMNWRLSRGQK